MSDVKLIFVSLSIFLSVQTIAQTDTSVKEFPFYFRSGFTEHFQINITKLADSINRMKTKLRHMDGDDSTRLATTLSIANPYIEINNDSSLKYALEARRIAQLTNSPADEARTNDFLGAVYIRLGNSTQALESLIKARNYYLAVNKNATQMIVIGRNLGDLYAKEGDTLLAKENYYNALSIKPRVSADFQFRSWALTGLGEIHLNSGNLDSAMYVIQESISISDKRDRTISRKYTSQAFHISGQIMLKRGDTAAAFQQMKRGLEAAYKHNNYQITGEIFMSMADIYSARKLSDSAFALYEAAYKVANEMRMAHLMEKSSERLKEYYKSRGNIDSAFYYAEQLTAASVSRRNIEKAKQTQTLTFKETLKEQESHAEAARSRSRIIYFSLASILGIVLISGIFLYRGYQKQREANSTLQKQKQEIQSTLELLRSTQKQLIQSEKMASLGELTAGIAHEIQNPLNFVNNFSELSGELLEEARAKRQEIKENGREVEELLDDIKLNLEKISHHGKRAEAIVKGMLQHSRSSSGVKESTDINALCDEYLRLAFHGIRGKDNTFNVTMKTDYDETIGRISIVPQDIGRVLLNLYNNAFYALAEKSKKTGETFEPTMTVSTKSISEFVNPLLPADAALNHQSANSLIISIKDNGNGIPEKVKDKIFQPFFTTKPPGQGTGLGLSLSYDIIKAHGGEINVKNVVSEGVEFIITLPINS